MDNDQKMCGAQWCPAHLAPENVCVMTRINDSTGIRNVQKLRRRGRLWFVPDGSVYVYYTPTEYRP